MSAGDSNNVIYGLCPSWALSVGYLGICCSVILSNFGAAYGTWRAGRTLLHSGIKNPQLIIKNMIPVVMAGVIGLYGVIVAIIIATDIPSPSNTRINSYSIFSAMGHLAAGICCGMSGLAGGLCIGIVGDVGIRSVGYHASNVTVFSMMPVHEFTENQNSSKDTSQSDTVPLKVAPWGSDRDDDNEKGQALGTSEGQNKLFVGMMVMLIFSEALALYGLIVALIVSQSKYECGDLQ